MGCETTREKIAINEFASPISLSISVKCFGKMGKRKSSRENKLEKRNVVNVVKIYHRAQFYMCIYIYINIYILILYADEIFVSRCFQSKERHLVLASFRLKLVSYTTPYSSPSGFVESTKPRAEEANIPK